MSQPLSWPRALPVSLLGTSLVAVALAVSTFGNAPTGQENIKGHADGVTTSDFSVETFEVTSDSGDLKLKIQHTTVGLMDPNIPPETFTVSPDGRHMAYMSMEGGEVIVYSDGVPSEPFEGFQPESLTYAPDGRLSYMGVRGKKSYVVVDGQEYKYGRISTGGIRFSMDGTRFGFVGKRSGTYFAVIDGQEFGPYEHISRQPIKFSQDNKHYGFIAKLGKTFHAIIDGEPGPGYEAIVTVRFSPKGTHTSYIAKNGEAWIPVLDGMELGRFQEVREPQFTFAANGTRPGLIVRKGKSWHVLLDGKLGPAYNDARNLSISQDGASTAYLAQREGTKHPFLVLNGKELTGNFSKLTFSPEGGSTAVVRGGKGKQSVLVNGKEGGVYDAILAPGAVFSKDGKHFLYAAAKQGKIVVVVDGEERDTLEKFGKVKPKFLASTGKYFYSIVENEKEVLVYNGTRSQPYEHFTRPALGANGRMACAARIQKGHWVAYIDGKEFGPAGERTKATSPTYLTVRKPTFDTSGERLAYCIWTASKKGHVVVDGQQGQPYDDIMSKTLGFSPDGKHVFYAAGTGEKRYIVIDDTHISGYRGFLSSLGFQFVEQNRMHIICSRETRFVLVEIEIES